MIMIRAAGFCILGDLYFESETFFHDGMIVATIVPETEGLASIELGTHRKTSQRNSMFMQPQSNEQCEILLQEYRNLL